MKLSLNHHMMRALEEPTSPPYSIGYTYLYSKMKLAFLSFRFHTKIPNHRYECLGFRGREN